MLVWTRNQVGVLIGGGNHMIAAINPHSSGTFVVVVRCADDPGKTRMRKGILTEEDGQRIAEEFATQLFQS